MKIEIEDKIKFKYLNDIINDGVSNERIQEDFNEIIGRLSDMIRYDLIIYISDDKEDFYMGDKYNLIKIILDDDIYSLLNNHHNESLGIHEYDLIDLIEEYIEFDREDLIDLINLIEI